MDLKFPTKAACRIAKIDHQRFNEDVAAGEYPCAPGTRAGVAREFDQYDIAGLFLYAHLMRIYEPARYAKKIAAMYACEVIQILRREGENEPTRVDFPLDGFNDTGILRGHEDPPCFGIAQHRAVAATISFDLKSIMSVVHHRMAQEVASDG